MRKNLELSLAITLLVMLTIRVFQTITGFTNDKTRVLTKDIRRCQKDIKRCEAEIEQLHRKLQTDYLRLDTKFSGIFSSLKKETEKKEGHVYINGALLKDQRPIEAYIKVFGDYNYSKECFESLDESEATYYWDNMDLTFDEKGIKKAYLYSLTKASQVKVNDYLTTIGNDYYSSLSELSKSLSLKTKDYEQEDGFYIVEGKYKLRLEGIRENESKKIKTIVIERV